MTPSNQTRHREDVPRALPQNARMPANANGTAARNPASASDGYGTQAQPPPPLRQRFVAVRPTPSTRPFAEAKLSTALVGFIPRIRDSEEAADCSISRGSPLWRVR